MKIALDYDGTYTLDPKSWNQFIASFTLHGHEIYVVTARSDTYGYVEESKEVLAALQDRVKAVYFTSGVSKRKFMQNKGINIDVWIDDMPEMIVEGI